VPAVLVRARVAHDLDEHLCPPAGGQVQADRTVCAERGAPSCATNGLRGAGSRRTRMAHMVDVGMSHFNIAKLT
jgi:hypothetical protein